jgi:FkbH-like protein
MGQEGQKVKCVVWDLDDTLWHGTLLENDDVALKTEMKHILASLDERGILHSIASKNDRGSAMRKLRQLGIEDYFLHPQIGWHSKSAMISAIRDGLNIGMTSILFVDDQPFERDEVRSAHPEVLCLDATEYRNILQLPSVNPTFVTDDSKCRRTRYLEDIRRTNDEKQYPGPQEDFLASLNMVLAISRASVADLQRIAELTLRTNQLNATGIAYSHDEILRYVTCDAHTVLVCELKDRYGSYGKIGLALVQMQELRWHIKLLLMSCRVLTRGVGAALLHFIMDECRKSGNALTADFKDTGKNRMMEIMYRLSNFSPVRRRPDGLVTLGNDLSVIPQMLPHLKLEVAPGIWARTPRSADHSLSPCSTTEIGAST